MHVARTHARFGTIRFSMLNGKILGMRRMRLREVRRARRFVANHGGLTAVRRIGPYTSFITMQQVRQHAAVVHVCRRRDERMNEPALAVNADMRLHPEVPFVTFFGLMHFGITFPAAVLRRTRRFDDLRINDRVGADLYLTASQKLITSRKIAGPKLFCSSKWRNLQTVVSSGTGASPKSMPATCVSKPCRRALLRHRDR